MVAPWPELLAELTPQQQQLQAADLADRWELPLARDAAVKLLQEAACSTYELSALLEGLLSMEGMQDFLLPVYEQVLLSKYGDLEAVWAPGAAALQESLMKLPLSAMHAAGIRQAQGTHESGCRASEAQWVLKSVSSAQPMYNYSLAKQCTL